MQLDEHGGQCCGIRHIFGVDRATVQELDEYIQHVDNMRNVTANPDAGRLIEIVLSARQVTGDRAPPGGWTAALQERGFRLVSRFNNAMYPLVMESRSKISGQWFVFPCTEDGTMMQGGRVVNVVNENVPEEW